jgi:hypothetical protein
MGMFTVFSAIITIVIFTFLVILNIQITDKAGYPAWWAVLGMIPVVNIILIWVFAFSEWPVHKKETSE